MIFCEGFTTHDIGTLIRLMGLNESFINDKEKLLGAVNLKQDTGDVVGGSCVFFFKGGMYLLSGHLASHTVQRSFLHPLQSYNLSLLYCRR